MLSYMTANDAAEKWGISRRRVITLCNENRIPDVAMLGNMWLIPLTAVKPFDRRIKKVLKNGKRVYRITIEEMVSKEFEVIAEDDAEAEKIATEKYNNGEFLLDPGNLVSKQMAVHNIADDYWTDWIEF